MSIEIEINGRVIRMGFRGAEILRYNPLTKSCIPSILLRTGGITLGAGLRDCYGKPTRFFIRRNKV